MGRHEPGSPFYGYATSGTDRAWAYYIGRTGKWKIFNSGAKLTVQNDGDVGIGTTSPSSTLHVGGGYIQFPARTGAPPAADCDSSTEYGRVIVRTDGSTNLYVCTASGWLGE